MLEGVAKLRSQGDYVVAMPAKVALLAVVDVGCLCNTWQAVEVHHPPLQQQLLISVTLLQSMQGNRSVKQE